MSPYMKTIGSTCVGENSASTVYTLKQCRNWQRDSFDYACTEDLTSMEWAKSLMMNSCYVLLVDRIDDMDLYEQGGVTYIKIALDEMFTISNTVDRSKAQIENNEDIKGKRSTEY